MCFAQEAGGALRWECYCVCADVELVSSVYTTVQQWVYLKLLPLTNTTCPIRLLDFSKLKSVIPCITDEGFFPQTSLQVNQAVHCYPDPPTPPPPPPIYCQGFVIKGTNHTGQIFLTRPSVSSCVRHGCHPLEKIPADLSDDWTVLIGHLSLPMHGLATYTLTFIYTCLFVYPKPNKYS